MDQTIWIYKTNSKCAESFQYMFVNYNMTSEIKTGVSSGGIAVEDSTNIQDYENISLLKPKYQRPNTWTQENKISNEDAFFIYDGDEYRYFAFVLFTAVDEDGYLSDESYQFKFSNKKNLLCLSKPIEISLSQERMKSLFGYEDEDPSENTAPGMAMSPSDEHQQQFLQNYSDLSKLIDQVAVPRPVDESSDENQDRVTTDASDDEDEDGVTTQSDQPQKQNESNTEPKNDPGPGEAIVGEDTIETDPSGELEQLRDEAIKDATENPSKNVQSVSPREPYFRSQKIKQYALERAAGTCEGCGKPAPFNRKNGESYLEVHHLDELGEGGADHPDKVVALCPNCHCRIHYGEGGEEYNNSLKERIDN